MFKRILEHKYQIFAATALVYMLIYFQRTSINVLAVDLMRDIHLTASQLGIISSSYFLFYAIMQPFIGYLVDRFGSKKVIIISFITTCLGSLLFAFIKDFNSAIIARSLIGFGSSGIFIPSVKLLADWFAPGQFARINGLFVSTGTAGVMLSTLPLAYMDMFLGWRNIFILFAFMGIIVAVVVYFLLKDRKQLNKIGSIKSRQEIKYFETVKALIFSYNFPLLLAIFFISSGVYISFQGLWATKYLVSELEIPVYVANSIIFYLPLGVLIGAPLGGYLSDKVFHNRTQPLQLALVLQLIFWGILTFFIPLMSLTVIAVILVLLGLAVGIIAPLLFAIVKDKTPSQVFGLSIGLLNPACFIGIFTFQLTTGFILDFYKTDNIYTPDTFLRMMSFCFIAMIFAAIFGFMLKEKVEYNLFQPLMALNLSKLPSELLHLIPARFTNLKDFHP